MKPTSWAAALLASLLIALTFRPGVTISAPSHHHASTAHKHASAPAATNDVTVWVNLPSGVYHYEGERWYGRTKNGEYMKESAAKAAGYRATENGQ